MKLNEVFDSALDWATGPGKQFQRDDEYKFPNPKLADRDKEIKPGYARWSVDTYNFKVNGKHYTVDFAPIHGEDDAFAPLPKNMPKHSDLATLSLRGDESITGTGDAFKVYATVAQIMKKHVERTNLPIVVGSHIKYPSRVKLYSRIFDKLASAKWQTDRKKYMEIDDGHDEVMWLIMPNALKRLPS